MADKSTLISATALAISFVSIGFTFFQWWSSGQENRINAAIEISKNHLRERDAATSVAIAHGINPEDPFTNEDLVRISKHAEALEYIAFLANSNRLEKSYLSPMVSCDIILTNITIAKLAKSDSYLKDKRWPNPEIENFIKTAKCDSDISAPLILNGVRNPKN
jgi:hypothetical protein